MKWYDYLFSLSPLAYLFKFLNILVTQLKSINIYCALPYTWCLHISNKIKFQKFFDSAFFSMEKDILP